MHMTVLHSPAPHSVVLVNLGTPGAPTAEAVHRYLREFLSDRRVVQLPGVLWRPLLDWVILPRRSPKVAEKYAEIWTEQGSPLLAHTVALAQALQVLLPDCPVLPAMRYGEPGLAAVLARLHGQGVRQATVLPLYPQYSTTTTASVEDLLAECQARFADLQIHCIRDYHRHPSWASAVADSIRRHWAQHGRAEQLVFSYHGIPARLVHQGDPYAEQCEASTAAIADALDIARQDVLLTYQSRFGRERWLTPYTQPSLEQLALGGVREVDIVCPGFAVDCLETLEEIALQSAEAFRAAGGRRLRYIPCLNASTPHAEALLGVLRTHHGIVSVP